MDAPKGRYRVIEKDGRLIVIDNGTGRPIPSSMAPPPGGRRGSGGQPPPPVEPAGPGPLDRAADFLVACAVKQWDSDGRAVIGWELGEKGKGQRWDAVLDEAEQRRLGRALLGLGAAPVFLAFLIFADGTLFAAAALLSLPPLAWAVGSILRLYGETNDPSLRG
jgi:hypothetical protein